MSQIPYSKTIKCFVFYSCISWLRWPYKNTTNRLSRQQKFLSSRGWKSQDQGVGRFDFSWGLSPWIVDSHTLISLPLLPMSTVTLDYNPTLMEPHLTLVISLKTISPNNNHTGNWGFLLWILRTQFESLTLAASVLLCIQYHDYTENHIDFSYAHIFWSDNLETSITLK